MSGHTPGPWRVFRQHNPAPEYSTTWHLDSQTRGYMAILTVMDLNSSPKWRAENPEAVAEHEETLQEVEANARLIAAAPELLAALLQRVQRCPVCMHKDGDGSCWQCESDLKVLNDVRGIS